MIKQFSVALLTLMGTSAFAQKIENPSIKSKTTFAIIVDDVTMAKTQQAIKAYKTAVEKEGLGTYIISHSWKKPEEIKTILQDLYSKSQPLEGAVFVGDIPVPMVRDAQQLTSAFKMPQRIDWQRSSVPSDRFYDDFHLKFNFLKQDSLKANLFYYSLDASSQQDIHLSIYTGRIKPPAIPGKDKYQLITQYLNSVVAEKSKVNKLTDLLVYTGQGYNSESMNSWAGEQVSLREQMPDLFRPGSTVKFMNFQMELPIKFSLLSELRRNDLDMAILHHHGVDDQQLMNGLPYVSNPNPSIANIKRYLRSKVQSDANSKKPNLEGTKNRFVESLGVPMEWMNDALTDSVKMADSIYNDELNINITDLVNTDFNARFIMLDACYNGAFHLDDYIAGYYPFSGGKNMVTIANSIGVLQDLWPDEMLGLMQYGVRTGNWFRFITDLETHIIGDPTFHFANNGNQDLNASITSKTTDAATWKNLLNHPNADVQCLALVNLFNLKGKSLSGLLKDTYYSSPYGAVRMEALQLLYKINNYDTKEVLKASIFDPYEYVRRRTAYMLTEMGDDELIPVMVELAITDRHSKRVAFKTLSGMKFMNPDKVIAEIKKQIYGNPSLLQKDKLLEKMVRAQEYSKSKVEKDFNFLRDKSNTTKQRVSEMNILRNYTYHHHLPEVTKIILDPTEDDALRLIGLEALSWYNKSYQRPLILSTCEKILADKKAHASLKEQALRTKNKLLAS